jgi:REP element-mobilizing transposase RayT
MAIRVLIINRQLAFSVALKQALERTGAFDVHPFTTADAAVEYLQSHPQDVVLFDFSSVGSSAASVVGSLRHTQNRIPIVVSPQQNPDVMRTLNLQESIDPPFSARDVIPLLNRAVETGAAGDDALTRQFPEERPDVPPTRPSGGRTGRTTAPTSDPLKPRDLSESERGRLRPGEIGDEQLRPYMYSTDLFKHRQEEAKTTTDSLGKKAGARPGEITSEDLKEQISTDIFKQPPTPTGQIDGESKKRAPAQPRPEDVSTLSSGSDFDEQDLLNRALNRGVLSGADVREQPGSDDPYRVSTDIFKGEQQQESALSPEDAAAMWETLTREDTPVQPMLAVDIPAPEPAAAAEAAVEFESFDFGTDSDADEPAESAAPVSAATPAISDLLAAAVEAWELPPEGESAPEEKPLSSTDLLIKQVEEASLWADDEVAPADAAAAWEEEVRSWPTSQPDAELPEAASVQPPEAESGDEMPQRLGVTDEFPLPFTAPLGTGTLAKPDTDALNPSRKPTDPLPQSVRDEFVADDLLDQQYAVEGLVGGDGEVFEGRENSLPQSISKPIEEDVFEPPIAAEELIASWGQEVIDEDEADWDNEQFPAPDMTMSDEGVAQIEALAEQIRRAREAERYTAPPAPHETTDNVFNRLASEEPPMPAELDDGGTVGDLYVGVHDPSFQSVLQILRGDDSRSAAELQDAVDDGSELDEAVDRPSVTLAKRALLADADNLDRPTITQSEIDEIFSSFSRREAPREQFTFDEVQADEESNPAQLILETALDESVPPDTFSLAALIRSIERQLEQHRPSIRPLPSWQRDGSELREDRYVREPDFLAGVIAEVDALPEIDEVADAYGDATTYAGDVVESADDLETEYLPATVKRPQSLPEQDWSIEPPVTEEDTDGVTKPLEQVESPFIGGMPRIEDEEPEFSTEFERLAAFHLGEVEELDVTPPLGMPAIEDPYIAQIALSLTQISLDEVAAAILTHENEVIAFAGRMGRSDIDEIRAAVNDIWDTRSQQAVIRFVTLPSTGKDYMLYSRGTINDLTFSLVFSNVTPLRDIRKVGKRLTEALMVVPEPEAEPNGDGLEAAVLAAAQSDVRGLYTYVWTVRDPEQRLTETVARAIETGMSVQLSERNWKIIDLQVRDECVYLLADVPGEIPPFEIVRDLKRRSGEIARKQNPLLGRQSLWADSYLVVAPGRQLDDDEIQQFISFERMP